MPRRLSTCRAVAALFASALLAAPARADDPPAPAAPPAPAQPKPIPKIENALLESLVGSWDVAWKGMGMTATGASRVRKVAGGTTLLQETHLNVGGRDVDALQVVRVAEGGKEVKLWRFDTLGATEMTAFHGALADAGFEVSAESGAGVRLKKNDAGFEVAFLRGGEAAYVSTYTKAAKDVELAVPNAPKEGLTAGMIGAWDVAGEWTMPGKDGKPVTVKVKGVSTYRWALGGAAVVHDFDRTAPAATTSAVGVYRWPADGASMRVWWFDAMQVDPKLAEGPQDDAGWHGKGDMGDGMKMGLEWAKKGEGFEMRYVLDGKPAGFETFTRKK